MPAFCPKAPVCGASLWLILTVGGLVPSAQATSAGYHGPVELTLRNGVPCMHVTFNSPTEDEWGWGIQLQQGLEGPVIWLHDVPKAPVGRQEKAPVTAATCMPLSAVRLRAAQPYRVELGTYESYRSDFCWQPASAAHPTPQLLDVDPRNGQCTDLPWVGGDGDALTLRGTWHGLILWWRDLFKP